MILTIELFWSFRSPYSYFGTKRYRSMVEEQGLDIAIRPVFPLAIRKADFFKDINPLWPKYYMLDCQRVADYLGMPYQWPDPDPVMMDLTTMHISEEQPLIHRLTRLGVEATRRGKGLPYLDEMSSLIWGGTLKWDEGNHMAEAAERAGLNLVDMDKAIIRDEASLDAEIEINQLAHTAAGHWGVPTLVVNGEPFFGQDRIELAQWSIDQFKKQTS